MKSTSTKLVTRAGFPLLLICALAWASPQEASNHDLSGRPGPAPVAQPHLTPFQQTDAAQNRVAGRSAEAEEAFRALISKAEGGGPVAIIVGIDVPFRPEGFLDSADQVRAQRDNIARAQAGLLRGLPAADVSSVKKFPFIPYVAMHAGAGALTRLQNSPAVVSISEDVPLEISLAESVPLVGGTAAWAAGHSGAGQAVAILDTGVDKTHPFLSGKVISEACYSTSNTSYFSLCPGDVAQTAETGSGLNCNVHGDCVHGTHVAGIAAGRGPNFSGVAKDAKIIAIQVFSGHRAGGRPIAYPSDVALGLQRVQALQGAPELNGTNIAAANLSFGENVLSGPACDDWNDAMRDAINSLRSLGIATVIASGNDGSTTQIRFPACFSSAVSVGSTDDGGSGTTTDRVSPDSNNSPILSLLAPGRAITSSVPGGGFQSMSGTSMAAPHVAGAWGVLKSKFPNATVEQVLNALISTGVSVNDQRTTGLIKPRIRLDAALGALGTSGGGPKPILNYALVARGSAPYASSWLDLNRTPGAAVNGDRRGLHWGSDPWTGSGWHDATNNAFPDWLEVEFNAPQVINEVDVFSVQDNFQNPAVPTEAMTFTLYGLRDFDVEYWTGSGWAVVPGGAVVGNNKVWVKLTFPPVTTTRMRVVVKAGLSGYSRIVEFEAWGWDP